MKSHGTSNLSKLISSNKKNLLKTETNKILLTRLLINGYNLFSHKQYRETGLQENEGKKKESNKFNKKNNNNKPFGPKGTKKEYMTQCRNAIITKKKYCFSGSFVHNFPYNIPAKFNAPLYIRFHVREKKTLIFHPLVHTSYNKQNVPHARTIYYVNYFHPRTGQKKNKKKRKKNNL